ncbi:MAG: hypothetical protein ACXABY_10140 [Candidatus Thorarchaeota archaeon]|jgi:hypothetical protein
MSFEKKRSTASRKGDTFEVTIWQGPDNILGLNITDRNRELYFNPEVRTVVLHLDGVRCVSQLTDSFWNKCSEIRVAKDETDKNHLAAWIQMHGLRAPGTARALRGKPDVIVFRVVEPESEFMVSVR